MPRPEKPIDPDKGPIESFAQELRALRRSSGNPTYRELAKRAGFSSTALSSAARGDKLPSKEVCIAYVKSCGGDTEEWIEKWEKASFQLSLESNLAHNSQATARAVPHTAVHMPPDLRMETSTRLLLVVFTVIVAVDSLALVGLYLHVFGPSWTQLLLLVSPKP